MPTRTSRSPRASKASWPSSTMLPNLSMWPIASACSGWWSKKSRSDPKRSSSSTRSPCLTTLRIPVIYCVHGITMSEMRILSDRHLRRILTHYFTYYHGARTHLALDKDAPDARPVERPELGMIVQIPEVGGLHHRYVRRAA